MTKEEIEQLKLCFQNSNNYEFTIDGGMLIVTEGEEIILEADMDDILTAIGVKFEYA